MSREEKDRLLKMVLKEAECKVEDANFKLVKGQALEEEEVGLLLYFIGARLNEAFKIINTNEEE